MALFCLTTSWTGSRTRDISLAQIASPNSQNLHQHFKSLKRISEAPVNPGALSPPSPPALIQLLIAVAATFAADDRGSWPLAAAVDDGYTTFWK